MALVGTYWQFFGTAATGTIVSSQQSVVGKYREDKSHAIPDRPARHHSYYLYDASTLEIRECTYDGIGPLSRRNPGRD